MDIKSVLQERRVFQPPAAFAARARIGPEELSALHRQARQDPVGFWAELARGELHWHKPFSITLDDSAAPNYRWFCDGELNVSYNCLDVHLAERGDKTAIIFESEGGAVRRLSYRQLHAEVCRLANALTQQGVGAGDRVVIYLPMVPEAVIALQACARIGAIHSVVFGGFSALSLRERIEDAAPKLVLTADAGVRGGAPVPLKAAVDKALSEGCASVQRVLVLRHSGTPVAMQDGRDLWWHELVAHQSPQCEPRWLPAEHPLFLLNTSGSTGRSKGIQHASAGYLLGAKLTCEWVFDLCDDDVFWCTADVGWVTGHSYVAYGPLAAGATVMIYEGAPTFPDGGRYWQICQTHGVSVFYTAPTAIRALMRLGDEIPARYDLSRLRLLGSVGEPINPEAWVWYQRVIGGGRCPVVDTWWQTETGAIMIAPLPGVTATKPGSCTLPLPGIFADIVDERGRPVQRAGVGGYLVITRPWPSLARTIWQDNERYLATYWQKFDRRWYVAGDGAYRDADGYFWIVGRIDDVLNVAGHRLGTMEIESALVAHPRIAEAAVVGRPHEIKGEAVFAYVVCRGTRPAGTQAGALSEELRAWVAEQLSPIAKPDEIRFSEALPKTRSGKIMRRLLRAIARGQTITQDVSTLENPAIVAQLRGEDQAAAKTKKKAKARVRKAKAAGKKKRAAVAKMPRSKKKRAVAKSAGAGRRRKAAGRTKTVKARKRTKTAKTARAAKRAKTVTIAKSARHTASARRAARRGPRG
jgi:acetyl-CoA synthetase